MPEERYHMLGANPALRHSRTATALANSHNCHGPRTGATQAMKGSVGGTVNKTSFSALLLFAVIAATAAAAQTAPRGNAQTGKQLFEAKGCYSCHGFVGQGSREGPRLAPPLAFPAFLAQLREPRAIMPPYKEAILSDQQAADILAYLASVPRAPDPKSVPLLQQ